MPWRVLNLIPADRPGDLFTTAVAWMGIMLGGATWVWPELYQWTINTSHGAALFMPILGCIWLAVQIWSRLYRGK